MWTMAQLSYLEKQYFEQNKEAWSGDKQREFLDCIDLFHQVHL